MTVVTVTVTVTVAVAVVLFSNSVFFSRNGIILVCGHDANWT
jgi:hypothetical protein